jgi:hypothetical protein
MEMNQFFVKPPNLATRLWILIALSGILLQSAACNKAKELSQDSSNEYSNPVPSKQVNSGDWNSGGGYAITDQFNPWFVQNTKEVTYCIEIDERNFGQTLERSRQLIEEALKYWKAEFALAQPFQHPSDNEQVLLGTQTFNYIGAKCAENVDIRFQLGILNPQQKEYLKDPKDWVGHTARTSYDPVQLKGKGFIYISPVSGPLALDRKDLLQNRWQVANGLILKIVLMHELGHPFGMTFTDHPVMNSRLLGNLTGDSLKDALEPKSSFPHFFNRHPFVGLTRCRSEYTSLLSQPGNPFGVTDATACVRLVPKKEDPNHLAGELDIEIQQNLDGPFINAGTIVNLNCSSSYRQQGWLYLDKKQKVFKNTRDLQVYSLINSRSARCLGKFYPVRLDKDSTPPYSVNIHFQDDSMSALNFGGETLDREYVMQYLSIPVVQY